MSAPAKRRGMHPAVAGCGLLVSAVFAGWSLLGLRGPTPGSSGGAPASHPADVGAPADAVATAAASRDLLPEHGSYEGGDVRLAFAAAEQVEPPPAPAAEVDAPAGDSWRGLAPPQLRLGVVLVGTTSRRAVIEGALVGVGDRVQGGEVVAIDAGMVVLQHGDRRLTYDFQDAWPREYRAEAARRGSGATSAKEPRR